MSIITVTSLPAFVRRADKLFTEEELETLVHFLVRNPEEGDVIPGTGGLRKMRWFLGNKGKQGGHG